MKDRITFGNLSVTSHNGKELLDYKDIIISAFTENAKPRSTKSSRYYFIDCKIDVLEEGEISSLSIFGRLVKDTVLRREQYFQNGAIVPNNAELNTAPSAFFVINLLDHRVAYVPENPGAATIRTFSNTLEYFIKLHYNTFIRNLKSETGKPLTKIREEFPMPTISLTPIISKLSLKRYIESFSKITSLNIKVVKRNQDLDPGELFDQLSDDINALGPTASKLMITNNSEGLNISETHKFLESIAEQGYEDATIKGIDAHGTSLSGTNDDFALSIPSPNLPTESKAKAIQIYKKYQELKENRTIKVKDRPASSLEKLKAIKSENAQPA